MLELLDNNNKGIVGFQKILFIILAISLLLLLVMFVLLQSEFMTYLSDNLFTKSSYCETFNNPILGTIQCN